MQLTAHFSLEEFTVTNTGLPNEPDHAFALASLKRLAWYLEIVRSILGGNPIAVHSAYRSEAVNDAVGGVFNSAHHLGCAVDFTCEGFGDPFAIAHAIASDHALKFDQLIYEREWVHFSPFNPDHPTPRQQVLTLTGPGEYVWGIIR